MLSGGGRSEVVASQSVVIGDETDAERVLSAKDGCLFSDSGRIEKRRRYSALPETLAIRVSYRDFGCGRAKRGGDGTLSRFAGQSYPSGSPPLAEKLTVGNTRTGTLSLPFWIVVGYVAVLLALGAWAARLARRGREGFFLAGRELTAPLVAVTVTGLAIGGASTVGVAQKAFSGQGLAAGWYGVAWSVSALVVGLIVARRYRRLLVVTVPEMFQTYYGPSGRLACVVVQVAVQIVITSLQYVAGGAILHALLPEVFTSLHQGMVFSAVVFIALTVVGGLWSASLTNVLNVALIYAGIVLASLLSVRAAGGWQAMVDLLPAGEPYLHPVAGLGWRQIVEFVLVMVTCNIAFQATVQIAFAARSESTARRGFVAAAVLILPVSFLAAMVGVAAKAQFPDLGDSAAALPQLVGSLHPAVAGVTLAALWAADVSTACGLLLSSSTIVVRDIYLRYVRPQSRPEHALLVNRLVVLVIGLVTLALAWQINDILKALMQGLSLTTGPTVVVLFTFFAPRLCRRSSAWCTILAGIVTMVLWFAMPQTRLLSHVIFQEWVVCLAVFLLVPLVDRRRVTVATA